MNIELFLCTVHDDDEISNKNEGKSFLGGIKNLLRDLISLFVFYQEIDLDDMMEAFLFLLMWIFSYNFGVHIDSEVELGSGSF